MPEAGGSRACDAPTGPATNPWTLGSERGAVRVAGYRAHVRPLLPAGSSGESLDPATAGVVDDALGLVHRVLDELRAGTLARDARRTASMKDDGTPVTPADVEVDRVLREAVADAFPSHDVVSEELDPTAGDSEWHWVVDPVDGTSNFAAGLPHWGVSVALCRDGVPVAGVVDAPDLDARWVAVRGAGCRRDGAVVHARGDTALDDPAGAHLPLLTTLGTIARCNRDGGVRLNPRVLGATAIDHALVADGVAVAAIGLGPKVWDVAAAAVLIAEAGGATMTFGERPPLLPLEPGVDYATRAAPAFSGPSPATTQDLVRRLTPPDGWPAVVVQEM